MQSTGHTSTHERSFTLMHGSAMMYVIPALQRSEEHTSELQSRLHLVCRLLLEKKNAMTLRSLRAAPEPVPDDTPSTYQMATFIIPDPIRRQRPTVHEHHASPSHRTTLLPPLP